MKIRNIIIALFISFIFLASSAGAVTTYNCTALTGGAARALDSYSVNDLSDGDRAIVATSDDEFYYFEYQASETDAEATTNHPYRIRPDDYASSGVWYEQMPWVVHDRAPQNLLTNSGFDVWSNSTLENYGSAIVDDDCADDDTGDWTKDTGCHLVFDTDHYELDTDGASEGAYIPNVSYTKGHLYRISIQLKDGTATPSDVKLYAYDGTTNFYSANKDITGSFVTYTYVFTAGATTSSGRAGIRIGTSLAGNNIEIKAFTCYEVTPGCIGADVLGADGWSKDSTLDIYREPNGSNTKEGNYFASKMSPSAASDWLQWPLDGTEQNSEWLEKFAGRTITFGIWAKTSKANHLRFYIHDGSLDYSSYHTGGGSWEWIELSKTISSSLTRFEIRIYCEQSSGDVYISQPMLVFGSSIGEGNYSRPSGEIINLEEMTPFTNFNSASFSDVTTATTIYLEAQSNGALPIGLKAVHLLVKVNDSASAASDTYLQLFGPDSGQEVATITPMPVNDRKNRQVVRVPCDSSGNIAYKVEASGSETFDIFLQPIAVELR
jgi:hypothetical protein